MAKDLIHLSGKEPDKDIKIIFTGLREGEKMYEELITAEENLTSTAHEKIMVLRDKRFPVNCENSEIFKEWLNTQLASLFECAKHHDTRGLIKKLQEIVPEYNPSESDSDS